VEKKKICVGEIVGLETFTGKVQYRSIKTSQKQEYNGRFFLNLPYCIRVSKSESNLIIMYNDDVGVHIEEGLFAM